MIEFQSVQLTLTDIPLQVEAARALIKAKADTAGTGLPDPLKVSLAKCTANEMAKRVTDLAMHLHGGNGYTTESASSASNGTPMVGRSLVVRPTCSACGSLRSCSGDGSISVAEETVVQR